MSFVVYILFSDSCHKFYSGQTEDFANRFAEHNSGETKSIKSCIPWKLVWSIHVLSRNAAMKLETKIKKRGAKRYLQDIESGLV